MHGARWTLKQVEGDGWASRWLVAFLLLFAFLAAPVTAAKTEFPAFTGYVVDAGDALLPADEAALTAKLQAFQERTKQQVVVLTLPYDENRDIADYGYRLGREWGVGMREVNNGVVLLVVPYGPVGKRDVRIEVGYGLEPVLTDAVSSVIVNETIIPRFRANDIPGGIAAGADAIMAQIAAPDAEQQKKIDAANAAAKGEASDGSGGILIFWGIVAAFVILSMLRRRHGVANVRTSRFGGSSWPIILWSIADAFAQGSRGGRDDDDHGGGFGGFGGGSSGGGGGFGGGGGGGFGGGGASGSW